MVGEDWCAVTVTSKIIALKWRPVIIDRLLKGPKRFNELKQTIPQISSKVLVDNLINLEKEGILKRESNTVSSISVLYTLTEKGKDLKDVLKAIEKWGDQWLIKESSM